MKFAPSLNNAAVNCRALWLVAGLGVFHTAATEAQTTSTPFAPGPITARDGVLFHADGSEVKLWGVNYSFNLSWEYSNYFKPLGLPLTIETLRTIADRDFAELKQLNVKVVRVHLLPADFTDAEGNLVDTVYLQALDYLVARCRAEGIYVYLNLFNRMGPIPVRTSFAAKRIGSDALREKRPYLFDPALLTPFENYVRHLLERVNPLTGTAYGDEAAIAVWELMNEPEYLEPKHLSQPGFEGVRDDYNAWLAESKRTDSAETFQSYQSEKLQRFLNRFYDAIRATGARQPIFWTYNWPDFMSHHRALAPAILESRVDGISFCLYPGQNDIPYPIDHTKLPDLSGRNFLPKLAPTGIDWRDVIAARRAGKAVIVYEFETWCNNTGYAYPAMARLFRELGAQIACMWEYEPAVAATYNFVPSHFLNLRTTPEKAISFLIAGEVFNALPRAENMPGATFEAGRHQFGPFGSSFAATTSWCVLPNKVLYSHGLPENLATGKLPESPDVLIGSGSSAAITAEGNGIYRLEKRGKDYQFTVFPNVKILGNLWADQEERNPLARVELSETTPRTFHFHLPGWTGTFSARSSSGSVSTAQDGRVTLPPGEYFLSR